MLQKCNQSPSTAILSLLVLSTPSPSTICHLLHTRRFLSCRYHLLIHFYELPAWRATMTRSTDFAVYHGHNDALHFTHLTENLAVSVAVERTPSTLDQHSLHHHRTFLGLHWWLRGSEKQEENNIAYLRTAVANKRAQDSISGTWLPSSWTVQRFKIYFDWCAKTFHMHGNTKYQ